MSEMQMTFEQARAYPMVHAPSHAFSWQGGFLKSVRRVIQEWSDDYPEDEVTGSVLGWVHKSELEVFMDDDEVDTLAFISVHAPGVCLWVAGADMLYTVPKYEDHIRISERPYLDCSCTVCRMKQHEVDENVREAVLKADVCTDCVETFQYELCDHCARALDDEVLEAISDHMRAQREHEQEMNDIILVAAGELARQYNEHLLLEDKARRHVRNQLDNELVTPLVRELLERIGASVCKLDGEVKEYGILFTRDSHGCVDMMDIPLPELGKYVSVRIAGF